MVTNGTERRTKSSLRRKNSLGGSQEKWIWPAKRNQRDKWTLSDGGGRTQNENEVNGGYAWAEVSTKHTKNSSTSKTLAQILRIRKKKKYRNNETKTNFPLKSTQLHGSKTQRSSPSFAHLIIETQSLDLGSLSQSLNFKSRTHEAQLEDQKPKKS
jgi:hypothetical protein